MSHQFCTSTCSTLNKMIFIQPNMQVQEELASLFTRNLTLDPSQQLPPEEPKIVYISQHYNHSAHLAKQQQDQQQAEAQSQSQNQPEPQQPQRPASEPPQSENPDLENILRTYGVDTSALSPSQIQLFKAADDSQKMRLIQLWSICPPTNSIDNPTLAWSSTTLEQEETLAKIRMERKVQEHETPKVMSLDGTMLTPIQAGDGRWMQPQNYMEPYMASGYEEMARREYEASASRGGDYDMSMEPRSKDVYSHFGTSVGGPTYSPATDPVYKTTNTGLDWQRQAAMENQYGAYHQWRDEEML